MPGLSNRVAVWVALAFALWVASGWPQRSRAQNSEPSAATSNNPTTITNLAQLCGAVSSQESFYGNLRLEFVVCASSRPEIGVVVAQDDTGVELLELGRRREELTRGQKIRIEGNSVFFRRRELGTQISAAPLVADDGLHKSTTVTGEVMLTAGPVPLELHWFNGFRNFTLQVLLKQPDRPLQRIPDSALWHSARGPSPGPTNLVRGLSVECYQGSWVQVPDFDLLRPVKFGTAKNFDLRFRIQDEMVGLRYTGFFEAPSDGRYTFQVSSDDGSLLFIGPVEVPLSRLGVGAPPVAPSGLIGQAMDQLDERRWISLAGRVSFTCQRGAGLDLELRSGADTVSVTIADAADLEPSALLNAYVRVVGVGRAALSGSQRVILDRLFVASGADLKRVAIETDSAGSSARLMDIGQVQTIKIHEAKLEMPVRVRGVVTAVNPSDRWLALQDDTRGIFVDLHVQSNAFPSHAELCEVIGHTAAGNFAPIVVAEQLKQLGRGRLPEPARPSWNELANGSMDVQWVEFQGLVSEVHSNVLDLLLPEGPLQVRLENHFEAELSRYQHAVVRIRGTLFAIWNPNTREVQFGSLLVRNADINVDTAPPTDPFDAPAKTVRDLLLFDAGATAFRPVKVRAQVLYSDSQGVFAADQGMGLRILASGAAELRAGDLVEAVGYPEISGPSPLLRQALVRKTGIAPLPGPMVLAGPDLARKGLDSTLVRVNAKLMAMHSEQNSRVLELQSGGRLFVARIKPYPAAQLPLRLGSTLQLSGVLCGSGQHPLSASQAGSFELLLNSPADVLVLSQPSWWTLGRLGTVVGFLIVVLMLAGAWINQLRRQVEQRTVQLQREMRERERAEHHQALEAERSRIARDLHDDLGSSLTEIGVLASTGQRSNGSGSAPELFGAIAGKARGSIAALDVIVWAVDPEDNSLQSLADYLSGFVGEYLSHSNVVCRFRIPVTLPALMFEGRARHDLFLAVKETLNNIVRHAQASAVEFGITIARDCLEIMIADNGKGFDTTAECEGNGLKNLRGRLSKLGGSCAIDSVVGNGTKVRIRLRLPGPQAGGDVTD